MIRAFSKIWIIGILAVVLAGGVFAWQYFDGTKKVAKDETADWQTYRNEEYGFEIKYPSEFTFSLEGPNSAQQAINKGGQVSGTTQPSYDTVIFSDSNNEVGKIEIFHTSPENILKENYKDKGYLYLFGPCDIRFRFQPEIFNLNLVNDIKILTVEGKDQKGVSENCNYLKNTDGNLIVVSSREYKLDIFNRMLSTIRFLKKTTMPSLVKASITVLSPNNKERWLLGDNHTITWKSVGSIPTVSINLYKEGGILKETIAANISNTGSWTWDIPSIIQSGYTYYIRIFNPISPNIFDESDDFFGIIAPPSIIIASPNGGEKWELEKPLTVVWSTYNFGITPTSDSYVNVFLETRGLKDGRLNEFGIPASQDRFTWSGLKYFTETESGDRTYYSPKSGEEYKIRLIYVWDTKAQPVKASEDVSDNYFSIIK